MTNPNQELLSWAVESIKEWNHDYTHLRSDKSTSPVFYTTGYWHVIHRNIWDNPSKDGWRGQWCNLVGKKFSTDSPQVITKEEWLEGVALLKHYDDGLVMDAPTSSSEAQQGHVHAEIMAEYALVAKTNPEPWKEFEALNSEVKGWEELDTSPRWFEDAQYRRKPTPPKTMNIGGIVVEAWPLEEMPPAGLSYWALIVEDNAKFDVDKFTNDQDSLDEAILHAGKAFSTKEQAQAVADALNLVYNRAIGRGEG
jgi:hypothetical protein